MQSLKPFKPTSINKYILWMDTPKKCIVTGGFYPRLTSMLQFRKAITKEQSSEPQLENQKFFYVPDFSAF